MTSFPMPKRVGIIGTGSAYPSRVLTNEEISQFVDTSDEWIRTRSGIVERRIAAEGETTSDFSVAAAKIALERAGLTADDIDLIILATVTGDMQVPATASIIQHRLGASNVPAFDLSAGCSGWVYGIATANAFVSSGLYRRVLVIGTDLLSHITNWTDRSTCVLFGDASGAVIVAPVADDVGFLNFELGSDGSGATLLMVPAGGSKLPLTPELLAAHQNTLTMSGRDVFKFAVRVQSDVIARLLAQAGLTTEDVNLVVPHQANIRIIEAAIQRLGIPPEKFFINLHKYGNTSAASIPLAMDEAYQEGRIKRGDIVVVAGFGAGLTWAGSIMRWAY